MYVICADTRMNRPKNGSGTQGDITADCGINIMIGPPSDENDCNIMLSLFLSNRGKHIVCGGTTAKIVAEYLNKPIRTALAYPDPQIPPTAEIEGIDLVTEGVVTIKRVTEYAKDCFENRAGIKQYHGRHDGASLLSRMLFEEATDISFYIGKAVNPAHQNIGLPIAFNDKMRYINELTDFLKKMGKRVTVSYF